MISTQRKSAEIRRFNKKRQPRPTVLFYPIVFLLFQKRKQPAGKTLPNRLLLLDKTEKITHFRHFSKKKALHNCIICAVRLWLREPSSYLMYNHTLHKKDSIKSSGTKQEISCYTAAFHCLSYLLKYLCTTPYFKYTKIHLCFLNLTIIKKKIIDA